MYIVDLPACGRSPFTWNGQPYLAARANTLDTGVVERDLTAPAGQTYESWPTAKFHDKWPGVCASRDRNDGGMNPNQDQNNGPLT